MHTISPLSHTAILIHTEVFKALAWIQSTSFTDVNCLLESDCPLPNNFSYHGDIPQTVRSFEGIYHSNFNETIVRLLSVEVLFMETVS